jgi:DNA-binding CsgD family transcriptional regulator
MSSPKHTYFYKESSGKPSKVNKQYKIGILSQDLVYIKKLQEVFFLSEDFFINYCGVAWDSRLLDLGLDVILIDGNTLTISCSILPKNMKLIIFNSTQEQTHSSRQIVYLSRIIENNLPQVLLNFVLNNFESKTQTQVYDSLTPREFEIFYLLSRGSSQKMISFQLSISINTVKTLIKRIYQKLDVHSVTEALAKMRG